MEVVPREIKKFISALLALAPSARPAIEPGGVEAGNWWIDILKPRHVTIEWRPKRGFGLSTESGESYGEGPAEIILDPEIAARRVSQLLHSCPPTAPSGLKMLRELFGLTQAQMAKRLKKRQAAISRLEHRDDSRIETVREYVESMGGRIEVRALFPGTRIPIYSYGSETSPNGASKSSRSARA